MKADLTAVTLSHRIINGEIYIRREFDHWSIDRLAYTTYFTMPPPDIATYFTMPPPDIGLDDRYIPESVRWVSSMVVDMKIDSCIDWSIDEYRFIASGWIKDKDFGMFLMRWS